jgi:hypothetical protein
MCVAARHGGDEVMQVLAVSTPARPDWRWRIVNYSGDVVEESRDTFSSIATAVKDGTRRMNELSDEDLAQRSLVRARSW